MEKDRHWTGREEGRREEQASANIPGIPQRDFLPMLPFLKWFEVIPVGSEATVLSQTSLVLNHEFAKQKKNLVFNYHIFF